MEKKIALHGSYYIDNFGDSLFVVYFYKWLKETNLIRDEDIILPYANDRVRNLVKVSDNKGFFGLLKSKKIVFFGGGYLGERPNKKMIWNIRLLIRHLSIGLLAVLLKKHFIFIGVGAGPLTNSLTRKIVVFLSNKSEKIIVRDDESYNFLLEYGVDKEKLGTTADSILLLEESDVDEYWNEKYKKELMIEESVNTTYIGVHLQASSSKEEKLKLIIEDLKEYCGNLKDYKIVVFNDTYRKTPNNRSLNLVYEKFDKEKVMNIEYLNPDQLIAVINNLDIVITTKLHCGIVANCLGKYTLSVSVHDKTIRLYKQLKLQERNVSISDFKEGMLNKMFSGFDENKKYYDNVPLNIKKLAAENQKSLINFIKHS